MVDEKGLYEHSSQGQINSQRTIIEYLSKLVNATTEEITVDLAEFGLIYLLALRDRRLRRAMYKTIPKAMARGADILFAMSQRAKREHRYVDRDTISQTLARTIPAED